MLQKRVLYGLTFLLSIPAALALDITWEGVRDKLIYIGGLGWLGLNDALAISAFTRILIGILVFTLFFGVLTSISGRGGGADFLNRGQAAVVAGILAMISAIFMPVSILLGAGAGWATAVALLIVGAPVVGVGYVLFNLNNWITSSRDETVTTAFLKVILCVFLLIILTAMKQHMGNL